MFNLSFLFLIIFNCIGNNALCAEEKPSLYDSLNQSPPTSAESSPGGISAVGDGSHSEGFNTPSTNPTSSDPQSSNITSPLSESFPNNNHRLEKNQISPSLLPYGVDLKSMLPLPQTSPANPTYLKRSYSCPEMGRGVSPQEECRKAQAECRKAQEECRTPQLLAHKNIADQETPIESQILLLRIAMAYLSYPSTEKLSLGNTMPPGELLHRYGYTIEHPSKDVTLFINAERQKLTIGLRGTNCAQTLAASLGSCANWGPSDYDKVASTALGSFGNITTKPYSIFMFGMGAISSITNYLWYTNNQYISNLPLNILCITIPCMFITISMYFNIFPKLFYRKFDAHVYKVNKTITETIKNELYNTYEIDFVGHSLGGLLAQMASGIHRKEAHVFSAPGSAYELLTAFLGLHKQEVDQGIPPWKDFSKKIHAYGIEGDPATKLQHQEDISNFVTFPNDEDGNPHKIWTLYKTVIGRLSHDSFKSSLPPLQNLDDRIESILLLPPSIVNRKHNT